MDAELPLMREVYPDLAAPKPDGAYGPGHRNVLLSPPRGSIILDVVRDEIMFVELLSLPPLRTSEPRPRRAGADAAGKCLGGAGSFGHDRLVDTDTYLETERLTLRYFTADDAELLIELDGDPAVMRYLTGGAPTAPEVVREGHLPGILAGYERWGGELGLFAAYENDGGAFIGWFCLRPERQGPRDEAELGYRLRKAAWGRGYATEVSRALLEKGFTELGLRTVWAETMSVNQGSRNVMEKVGMTFAEELPTPSDMQMVEGAEHGGVRFEISREQWEQQGQQEQR